MTQIEQQRKKNNNKHDNEIKIARFVTRNCAIPQWCAHDFFGIVGIGDGYRDSSFFDPISQ